MQNIKRYEVEESIKIFNLDLHKKIINCEV